MTLTKETIEKAVSWWAGKLIDSQPHSNGDLGFSSVVECFLADAARQDVTLDQLNVFKKLWESGLKKPRKRTFLALPWSATTDRAEFWQNPQMKPGSARRTFRSKQQCFFLKKRAL